ALSVHHRHYNPHNHLPHSSPTRRSSDLGAGSMPSKSPPAPAPRSAGKQGPPRTTKSADAGRLAPAAKPSPPRRRQNTPSPGQRRSEEHTSELQSPDHLVCRLLLEQKKKD